MLHIQLSKRLMYVTTAADWEYGEGEVEEAVESDSDDAGPTTVPDSEYDFYRLSNLDFDTMTRKYYTY